MTVEILVIEAIKTQICVFKMIYLLSVFVSWYDPILFCSGRLYRSSPYRNWLCRGQLMNIKYPLGTWNALQCKYYIWIVIKPSNLRTVLFTAYCIPCFIPWVARSMKMMTSWSESDQLPYQLITFPVKWNVVHIVVNNFTTPARSISTWIIENTSVQLLYINWNQIKQYKAISLWQRLYSILHAFSGSVKIFTTRREADYRQISNINPQI